MKEGWRSDMAITNSSRTLRPNINVTNDTRGMVVPIWPSPNLHQTPGPNINTTKGHEEGMAVRYGHHQSEYHLIPRSTHNRDSVVVPEWPITNPSIINSTQQCYGYIITEGLKLENPIHVAKAKGPMRVSHLCRTVAKSKIIKDAQNKD